MDPWELVRTERLALADLLAGLRSEQWQHRTLCPAWSVHDIAAHLVSVLEAGPWQMAKAFWAAGARPARATVVLARWWRDRSPEDLVVALRAHADSHFAPPGLGYRSSLTDIMVHRMDIALPLELPVERPPESWRPVLDFLTAGVPMLGSIRGGRPRIAWHATDLGWSKGEGPEASGPAAAVGMALAGRGALLDRLAGPGVPAVRAWLDGG